MSFHLRRTLTVSRTLPLLHSNSTSFSVPLYCRLQATKRTASWTADGYKHKWRRAWSPGANPKTQVKPLSLRDEDGEIIWPAPKNKIKAARDFIHECVSAKQRTLIVPDRDVDGLASGAILERTLVLLGLDKDLISVYTIRKGGRLDDDVSRRAMAAYKPAFIFVLDHGSQESPPLIDAPHRAIVIDHHYAKENAHPQDALLVTADNRPPVATSSLLTYLICLDLDEEVKEICDWLCVLGTLGELGNMAKWWQPPFPDMRPTIDMYKLNIIYQAISLIHAPRRAASCDVTIAWKALRAASSPKELTKDKNLVAAKREVHEEFMRCNKSAAPRFSADGRVAVIYVSSATQVHPLMASRWASYIYTDLVEVILVANEGYSPGMVSFSCRVAKCAKDMFPPVDTIKFLRETADRAADPTLRDRLGESFARGHKVASGGKVPKAEFEELMEALKLGPKVHGFKKTKARVLSRNV